MKKTRHISLDVDLYQKIKILAAKLGDTHANELIEEGMKLVLIKHGEMKENSSDQDDS